MRRVLAAVALLALLAGAAPSAPPTGMELVGFWYRDVNPQNCDDYAPETPDHEAAHEDTIHQRIWQGRGDWSFVFTVCTEPGHQGSSSISVRVGFDPQFRSASGYIVGPTGEVRDFITVEPPGAFGGDMPVTIGACWMPFLTINGNTGDNRYIPGGTYTVVVTDLGPGPNTRKGAKGYKQLSIVAFEDMGYRYSQEYCPDRDNYLDGS